MSKYLAIIDSYRLANIILSGEVTVSSFEIEEFTDPTPPDYLYTDLLEENWTLNNLSDKIFLMVTVLQERDPERGLSISVSEIDFIQTLTQESQNALSNQYPNFIFETVPNKDTVITRFLDFIVRREASLGAVACRILQGLCEAPTPINAATMLEFVPNLPTDLILGLTLKAKNIPFYKTKYNQRTLLSLVITYTRSQNYPKNDLGYCFDMLEIYHYTKNRADLDEPNMDKIRSASNLYSSLSELLIGKDDISLSEAIDLIKKEPSLQPFFNTINNLSNGMTYVLFHFIKAKDKISQLGVTRSLINNISFELDTIREKEYFSLLLGGHLGFRCLSATLYHSLELPVTVSPRNNLDFQIERESERIIDSEENSVPNQMESFSSSENNFQFQNIQFDRLDEKPVKAQTNTALFVSHLLGNVRGFSNGIDLSTPLPTDPLALMEAANDKSIIGASILDDDNFDVFGIDPLLGDGALDFNFLDTSSDNNDNLFLEEVIQENKQFLELTTTDKSDESIPSITSSHSSNGARSNKVFLGINHKQRKVAHYNIAYLRWFTEALEVNRTFESVTANELRTVISSIIKSEAPIRKDLIDKRIQQIAKNIGIVPKKSDITRINQEIAYVISKFDYTVDDEDFVYRTNKPVFARDRTAIPDDTRQLKELRSAQYVCRKEIIAAFNIIKDYQNLAFAEPSAYDICVLLGLSENTASKSYKSNCIRIEEVLSAPQYDLRPKTDDEDENQNNNICQLETA